MTERVLIMRHASGLVNRARRLAITKWPTAKLEVHDLAAYGKPPTDFRWDRYAHLLIDDEYLRKEGLLWLSELRVKPNFPKIVRVLAEATRHKPPAEIEVKAPPMPERKAESRPAAAEIKPMPKQEAAKSESPKPDVKATTQPEPIVDHAAAVARAEARRLADAEAVLKSAGITGF